MNALRIPIRQSLSYRQTRNTVIVAFVIGVILSSGQIYLDYFSQRSEIQDSVRNTISTANRAAYHAAFNLDELGATQITRGLISNAPIVRATILDHSGEVLGSAERESLTDVSAASRWLFGASEDISIELLNELEHRDPVGSLGLTIDPALTADSFLRRATIVFLSGFLRNFVLAVCLIAVFYYTTTRPLLTASAPIQRGVTDQQIPMPPGHHNDELGILIAAFNEHLWTIEEQHRQIRDTNENLEKLVAARTDELAQKNAELIRERELAVEASQSKSDFLAMMSHEIRTPMHGVLGMAELLAESPLDQEQSEYVEALTDSGRSLLALMNSVLDYAKYEQGHYELHESNFDLRRLVGGIVFLLSPTAEAKHVLLSTNLGASVPQFVRGDAEKLRQVLLNLLTNAIKFTEEGEVKLVVRPVPPLPGAEARLRFEVQDTGPGIPKAIQRQIFEPFRQAGTHIARHYGGSGLGLSICREIVLAQRGEIDVESEEGAGSTFWFELTYEIATFSHETGDSGNADNTPHGKFAMAKSATVLVVDDVAINRRLIEGQLGRSGYNIIGASDGLEALERARSTAVDLILMDLQMPVMDGLQATHRLRNMSDADVSSVPIVGITANLDKDRRSACLKAGMTEVIAKPIDAASLRQLLRNLLQQASNIDVALEQENSPSYLDRSVLQAHIDALGKLHVDSLYREAVEILRDRTTNLIKSCQDQSSTAEDDAHALAGLSSNYGLVCMGDLCARLETALGADNRTLVAELGERLEDTCTQTIWAVNHVLQQPSQQPLAAPIPKPSSQ